MSRANKRAVIRGSVLQDMVERGHLVGRQAAAALRLERDRENATRIGSPKGSDWDPPLGGRAPGDTERQISAFAAWEGVKGALPPSHRRVLGAIERASFAGPGRGLSALALKTGLAADREDALVKRGMVLMTMEAVADYYRLPVEEA